MPGKNGGLKITVAGALLLIGTGACSSDYGDTRPPVDQLAAGNTGLQSKDVVSATDQMATDLLSLPELNASSHQWTIVFSSVTNRTTDPTFSYDAFSQRLRAKIAQLGRGRVTLIENRDKFHDLQNKELDQPSGGGVPAGQNPDYALYVTVDEMPNRATSYYLVTATLLNFNTRVLTWTSPPYEVQTAR
jgi:Peptidoglycan-synthase activator LpoB